MKTILFLIALYFCHIVNGQGLRTMYGSFIWEDPNSIIKNIKTTWTTGFSGGGQLSFQRGYTTTTPYTSVGMSVPFFINQNPWLTYPGIYFNNNIFTGIEAHKYSTVSSLWLKDSYVSDSLLGIRDKWWYIIANVHPYNHTQVARRKSQFEDTVSIAFGKSLVFDDIFKEESNYVRIESANTTDLTFYDKNNTTGKTLTQLASGSTPNTTNGIGYYGDSIGLKSDTLEHDIELYTDNNSFYVIDSNYNGLQVSSGSVEISASNPTNDYYSRVQVRKDNIQLYASGNDDYDNSTELNVDTVGLRYSNASYNMSKWTGEYIPNIKYIRDSILGGGIAGRLLTKIGDSLNFGGTTNEKITINTNYVNSADPGIQINGTNGYASTFQINVGGVPIAYFGTTGNFVKGFWDTTAVKNYVSTHSITADTTSLSNRINLKQNITDTNTWDATRYYAKKAINDTIKKYFPRYLGNFQSNKFVHTFANDGNLVSNNGIELYNHAPATTGNRYKSSPALVFKSNSWDTDDNISRPSYYRIFSNSQPGTFGASYLYFQNTSDTNTWPSTSPYFQNTVLTVGGVYSLSTSSSIRMNYIFSSSATQNMNFGLYGDNNSYNIRFQKNLSATAVDLAQITNTGRFLIGNFTDDNTNMIQSLGTIRSGRGIITNSVLDTVHGVTLKGAAIVYDDLSFPATSITSVGAAGKPDFSTANLTLLFPQNDTTEQVGYVFQLPHTFAEGVDSIYPHIHIDQSANQQATFRILYKWYNKGATEPATWTLLQSNGYLYTYSSGTLHQIIKFPGIISTGKTISSTLKVKFYRNDNVYTGDLPVTQFDIHYPVDAMGSNTPTSKN